MPFVMLMKKLFVGTLALLFLFGTEPSFAGENWGHGPIELDNQYPLALLHSSVRPNSPEVGDTGSYTGRLSFVWSSTFTPQADSYFVDAETRVTELELATVPWDDIQLGVRVPLVWRGSGMLDEVIDWWHLRFGLPKGQRDKFEQNKYRIQGTNDGGQFFSLDEEGLRFGDVSLYGKLLLSEGGESAPAWALTSSFRLPTGGSQYGQDGVDIELGTTLSKRWGWFIVYTGAQYIFYQDVSEQALRYERHHFGGFLHSEVELYDELSFHLGLLLESALLENVSRFPDYSFYLDTGFTYELSESLLLELLVRENPSPRYGTTDYTMAFGLRFLEL